MKIIISFLLCLVLSAVGAAPVAHTFDITGSSAFLINFSAISFVGVIDFYFPVSITGITQLALNKQIWTKQIMEKFYAEAGHLARCQDMTEFVEYNTINLADAGADPTVLIDNSTYPIAVDPRSDNPLTIALSRFRTENTVIRDAEAVELSYAKMESVIRGHRNALIETTAAKATHSWSPAADGAYTPVNATTGATSTFDATRKAITIADIAKAKRALDLIKVPQKGRVLVLHPTHQAELLAADSALQKAFANLTTGQIYTLFGFDIYVSTLTAKYLVSAGTKITYGAAALSTDAVSSLFYHEMEVMKCDGDVKMFSRLQDPEADGDIVGFSKRFVGLPIRNKYQGVIYSAAA